MAWDGGWQIGTSAAIPLEITEKLQYGIGKKKDLSAGGLGDPKSSTNHLWRKGKGELGGLRVQLGAGLLISL